MANTKRFCMNCLRVTKFEYVRTVGHSECTECGIRFGLNPENVYIIEDVLRKFYNINAKKRMINKGDIDGK